MMTKLIARARELVVGAARLLSTEGAQRVLMLGVLFALFGFYKYQFTSHAFGTGVDGGYYSDIAAHVRDGNGLVTDVSLHHKGYGEFPHRTSIYPRWPLIYGCVARFAPLLSAGKWLATALYFITLTFGYLWGRTLYSKVLFPRALPGFDAGHLFVVLFGLNREFFRYTTLPYTEGLAYALCLLGLWRASKHFAKPTWRGGAEIGLLFALALLARTQMVLLIMAAAPVLIGAMLLVASKRKAYLRMSVACGVVFVLAMLPHYLFLRTFIDSPGLNDMLRFDQVHFSEGLSASNVVREKESFRAMLADRATGFPLAFALKGKYTYGKHFYAFQYAFPVAVLALAGAALRRYRRNDLRRAYRWLTKPERVPMVFFIVFAVGGLLSLHTIHKHTAYSQWVFQRRHGLTAAFLFYLSLLYLLVRSVVPGRALGVLILCTSTCMGLATTRGIAEKSLKSKSARPYRPALVKFLYKERDARGGKLVIALRQPQPLAPHTDGIGYHWFGSHTTYDDIAFMVTDLNVDFVVMGKSNMRFMRSRRWKKNFKKVGRKNGHRIFKPNKSLLKKRHRVTS